MKRIRIFFAVLVVLLALPIGVRASDDWAVIVDGFPKDTGMSVTDGFWEQYRPLFEIWSVALSVDTSLRVSITAYADATPYRKHHDLQNAAIALSRYNATVRFLVDEIEIPAWQILPAKTDEFAEKGSHFRRVELTLVQSKVPKQSQTQLVVQPPDTIVSLVRQDTITNFFCLAELGAGVSVTSFGKPTVVLRGRIGNPTLCFDAELGLSPASDEWKINDQSQQTKFRIIAGHVAYVPSNMNQIELVVGWERNEERINSFGRYVVKREGPVFGLGWTYSDFLNIRAFWSPSEEDRYGKTRVCWHYNQFRVALYIVKL